MTTTQFLAALQGRYVEITKGEMPGFLNEKDQVRFSFEPDGTVLTVKINYGALNTVSGILVENPGDCFVILFNLPNHACDGFVSCFFNFEMKKNVFEPILWGAINASKGYSTQNEIMNAIGKPRASAKKARDHQEKKMRDGEYRGTGTGQAH